MSPAAGTARETALETASETALPLAASELHVILKGRARQVLIARPNVRQYGHLALEIFMAIEEAQRIGADVAFLRPRRVVGEALFQLEPAGVRVLQPNAVASLPYRLRWFVAHAGPEVERVADHAVTELKRASRYELRPHIDNVSLPETFRQQLRNFNARWLDLPKRVISDVPEPRYFSRRAFNRRIPVSLPPALDQLARQQAAEYGIPADARIVTLHVREAGYKRGQEMEDVKPGVREDAVRNAHIEHYFAAIEHLVGLGYTVVRLGDASMTPLAMPGVVDLALSPTRTNLLDVYCLLHSVFMIGCESGPSSLTYLTNTPCLWVNGTDPVTSYPIRADAMYLLKRVRDRRTRRFLTLEDRLQHDYIEHFRHTQRNEYFDNTPDEILAAAKEMEALVHERTPLTAQQSAFRERVTAAGVHFADRLAYVRKWGPDEGFLGDGRMAQVALDQDS